MTAYYVILGDLSQFGFFPTAAEARMAELLVNDVFTVVSVIL